MSAPAGGPPAFQRIADELRAAIRAGELAGKLPSEPALAERYGVQRGTARRALQALLAEGLVYAVHGTGWYVQPRDQPPLVYWASRPEDLGRGGTADLYVEELRRQGRVPSAEITVRWVPASEAVAARLRLPPQTRVLLRRLLRYADGHPSSVQASYYPPDLVTAADLDVPRDIPEGTLRRMTAAGWPETGRILEMTTRMPDPAEREQLRLPIGRPVLIEVVTGWAAPVGGQPLPGRVTATLYGPSAKVVVEEGELPRIAQVATAAFAGSAWLV